ncbi:hypothetical protein [uncultured Gammaproteobacteria bacterium]|nr:hypothetical protein [uncultured Gammaproteobacteria bacterium]CAC9970066.1 hypothetical protein [uncultured Gammaproteobacteria bacterium]
MLFYQIGRFWLNYTKVSLWFFDKLKSPFFNRVTEIFEIP